MKNAQRDRAMLVLLPAGILLVGFSLFTWPALQSLRKEQAAARAAAAISPADLQRQQQRSAQLRQDIDALEQNRVRLESQVGGIGSNPASVLPYLQADHDLTALFRRHRLDVLEAGSAVTGNEVKLPRSLAAAFERLGAARHARGQVRRVQLSGTFLDLRAALAELAQSSDSAIVPVSITMAEADTGGARRTWTLVVWM